MYKFYLFCFINQLNISFDGFYKTLLYFLVKDLMCNILYIFLNIRISCEPYTVAGKHLFPATFFGPYFFLSFHFCLKVKNRVVLLLNVSTGLNS